MTNDLINQPAGGGLPQDPSQQADYWRRYAQAYTETEPVAGQTISVNNGIMSIGDQPIIGNRFSAVILDGVHLNAYYGSAYNPNAVVPPTCYAIGRTEMEMAPHPDMAKDQNFFRPQAERCSGCPMNEYGSAQQGSGKACRNRRRLLLIIAGMYDQQGNLQPHTDPSYYETAAIMTLNIAPTSGKNWGRFIRDAAGQYNRPPFGVISDVYLYPHEKHGREAVGFNVQAPVPDALVPAVMRRHQEAAQQIFEGFEPPDPNQMGGGQQQQVRGGGFQGYGNPGPQQNPQQGWQAGPGAPGFGGNQGGGFR